MGEEIFTEQPKKATRIFGLNKSNGFIKSLLTIVVSVFLSFGSVIFMTGQYKEKVDSTAGKLRELDDKRLKPLEDRTGELEKKEAVKDEQVKNLSQQVQSGFADIKQLISEMKRELKEEIRQKKDK